MDTGPRKQIVIHNDFTNFLINTPGADDPANLAEAARRELSSSADIISLAVGVGPEMSYYSPTHLAEVLGGNGDGDAHGGAQMRALTAGGVDPYSLVFNELRRGECTVLAKLRPNDCHHVAGHPGMASRFWQDHPQWRIGEVEASAGGAPSFDTCSCLCPQELENITRSRRPHLLDYAVPEVREFRLAVVREFMERYDVDGLTLNFLREPFCISFPDLNAPLLTDFVAQCRQIAEQAVARRGKADVIMGAIVPWDPEYCRLMGLDVETWIRDGLLDYVSPCETWVSQFAMCIEPWVKMAASSGCAVYPGIVGFSAFDADFCLPEEYEPEGLGAKGSRVRSSKVTHENVRALCHGFYAEGAHGVSFFNFYSAFYHGLYPLPRICVPEGMEGEERRYLHMVQGPLFGEWSFLQVILPSGSNERKTFKYRLHENLTQVDAYVRFKARHLTDVASLRVDLNGQEVLQEQLSLIEHEGEGFLYVQFPLEEGMLLNGENEIGFAYRAGTSVFETDVIVQEVEVRVVPG